MESKEYRKIKKLTGNDYIPEFSYVEIEEYLVSLGEKSYRGRQLFSWLHEKYSANFDDITEFNTELQNKLKKNADLSLLQPIRESISEKDGTRKFLFKLADGKMIETVLMYSEKRRTVCLSSQVGCALKCSFCATGEMGLSRNLSAGEIVDQVLTVKRITGENITNIVFMGMGEPFHNYDNVIKAADIINHQKGLDIGARHITISTAGLADNIEKYLKDGHKYKLAVSISAGTDGLRKRIMPITKKYPLSSICDLIRKHHKRNSKPVTFEYVLLEGINDSDNEIMNFCTLTKGLNVKVNLIPYNSYSEKYRSPSEDRILEIYNKISKTGILVTIRWSSGNDIQAACGQLHSEIIA